MYTRTVSKKNVPTYFDNGKPVTDKKVVERLNKLAVPPAWQDVRIAKHSGSKIQATGIDSAGRKQAIYSEAFRLRQEKLKFDRIMRFALRLPKLRKQLKRDLAHKRLGKEKVLACVVTLIDEAYFRVGNDRYARENQTYGVTTLRSKHADITSTTVTFDFIGKSGKHHVKKIRDPQLARIIRQLDELPGHEIFRYQDTSGAIHDLHASDVNAYIKQHMGEEFTAKDFRTWGGTMLAATAFLAEELEESSGKTAQKKAVNAVVKRVAKRLGNTPAVARSSYIDPRIIAAFEDGASFPKLRRTMKNMRPRTYLSVDEQCVVRLLSSSS